MGQRALVSVMAMVMSVGALLGTPVAAPGSATTALAAGNFTDANFREYSVFTGLTRPVSVRFASDGRAFVAEKAGVIKTYDSITDTTPSTVLDIQTEVNSYWDRGLLGLAIDPQFATNRTIYIYYVYDAPPGGTAPVWNDRCDPPPGGQPMAAW